MRSLVFCIEEPRLENPGADNVTASPREPLQMLSSVLAFYQDRNPQRAFKARQSKMVQFEKR